MNSTVYVVTMYDPGDEPILTSFNNEEAAKACCKYFESRYIRCYYEAMPLYSTFIGGDT